jgi:hypothetical protein
MKTFIPTLALGWLLASGAVPARAQAALESIPASAPAPTPPLNLSLPSTLGTPLPAAAQREAVVPAPAPAAAPVFPPTAESQVPHFDTSTPEGEFPLVPIDVAVQSSSEEVKRVAHWVSRSGDNAGLPFLLIDKANARVYAFRPGGVLLAAAPVLLGMAKGDELIAPNSAAMSEMPPHSRITPAGRFISRLAIDSDGKELLVLDYDAAISLHPVVKGTPEEHRAARLKSPTSDDNRISFGCINVPPDFYKSFISATFKHTRGIVYVLPETGPASALFGFNPDEASALGAPQAASAMSASPVATLPDSAAAANAPLPVAN